MATNETSVANSMSGFNRQLDNRIGAVFVSHPKSGFEERETHIVDQFARFGIPFEFVGMFLKEEITTEVRNRFNIGPDLKAGNASNAINHMSAYRKILETDLRCGLIFEDDVVLRKNFHYVLTHVLDELEHVEGPFVVYLANSMNRYVSRNERRKGQYLYRTDNSKSPDAYLISREAARARLDYVASHGMNAPHGIVYSRHADKGGGTKVYWIEPTIAVPGSTSGRFETSLSRRWRWRPARKFRWYWKMLFTRFRGVPLERR